MPEETSTVTSLTMNGTIIEQASITSLDKTGITSLVTVIKWEINHLLARLSYYGVETFAISLDLLEGCVTELGSKSGLDFLSVTDCSNFKDEFLAFCRDIQTKSMDIESSCDNRNQDTVIENSHKILTQHHGKKRKNPRREYLRSCKLSKLHLNGSINALSESETSLLNNGIVIEENHEERLNDLKTIVKSRRKRTPQKLPARDLRVDATVVKNETEVAWEQNDIHGGHITDLGYEIEDKSVDESVLLHPMNDVPVDHNDAIPESERCDKNASHFEIGSAIKTPQSSTHNAEIHNIPPILYNNNDLPVNVQSDVCDTTSESVTTATVPFLQSVFPEVKSESLLHSFENVEEYLASNDLAYFVPPEDNADTPSKSSATIKSNPGKEIVKSKRKTEQVINRRTRKKGFKSVTVDEHSKETRLLNACRMTTGRYQCPLCHQQTRDRHDLKRHLRTHTKEKPFQCEICDKKFTRKWDLENHVTRHMDKDLQNVELESLHAMMSCKKTSVSDLPYNKLISDLLVKMNLENNMADSDDGAVNNIKDSAKPNVELGLTSLTNEMESEISNNSDTDLNSS
ncbi:hypothetical protein ACF0H5_024373 [Mactra antiquata]